MTVIYIRCTHIKTCWTKPNAAAHFDWPNYVAASGCHLFVCYAMTHDLCSPLVCILLREWNIPLAPRKYWQVWFQYYIFRQRVIWPFIPRLVLKRIQTVCCTHCDCFTHSTHFKTLHTVQTSGFNNRRLDFSCTDFGFTARQFVQAVT